MMGWTAGVPKRSTWSENQPLAGQVTVGRKLGGPVEMAVVVAERSRVIVFDPTT